MYHTKTIEDNAKELQKIIDYGLTRSLPDTDTHKKWLIEQAIQLQRNQILAAALTVPGELQPLEAIVIAINEGLNASLKQD